MALGQADGVRPVGDEMPARVIQLSDYRRDRSTKSRSSRDAFLPNEHPLALCGRRSIGSQGRACQQTPPRSKI